MPELSGVYRAVGEIRPHANNARTHPKKQVAQIAESILSAGFCNPILIDEEKVVIAGHGRLLAAKSLALTEVPTIQLMGLSEGQKAALRIADNKIAQNAGWDLDLLKIEIEAVRLDGLDLELTGFSVGEIDKLSLSLDPADDDIPVAPVEPVTREGDVWLLGAHRVACGDIRDEGLLSKVMDGQRADAAFLDPPYNVPINGHVGGSGKIKHREFAVASGEMSPEEFTGFLRDTLGACATVSRDGAVHFVCMDHPHIEELTSACNDVYGARLNLCVWAKSNAGMGGLYRSQHELVFVYRVGKATHRNNVELGKHGRNRTNVWEYASVNSFGSRAQDLELHPTVKPTAMVADAICDVTKTGDLVLDAFLGSGTTLIAAERTKRVFRGLDLDPLYLDVALARWIAMTGLEPIHLDSGRAYSSVRVERQKVQEPADVG